MNNKKDKKFEKGSGNVFADLGLEESAELFTRAQIGFHVIKTLKEHGFRQGKVVDLLEIEQPEVSHLMNGHFSRFSTEKLLEFLNKLDFKVTYQISDHKKGEPYREVAFVHA